MLWAKNENHPVVHGARRHDAATGPVSRLIQTLDPPRVDLDPLDSRAVEDGAVGR
jgi:hypothetical protein